MAREHPWPAIPGETADFEDVAIEPYRPGRIETEPGLRGRPHVVERGRRYWSLRGTIPQTDSDELAARIGEMLASAEVGSEVYTEVPFHWPSFAAGGADGGTKAGAISIKEVLREESGIVGIRLNSVNAGHPADATHGRLRRAPRVGDFFLVGSDRRLVQVTAVVDGETATPTIDFEEDLQLELQPGDPVAAPDEVRMQVTGDARTRFSPDWYGPWVGVSFIEFIPDPLGEIPKLLDRQYDLPDLDGAVGDQLTLTLGPVWIDPAGGEITYWVRADGGIEIEDSGDGAYTLTLERAGQWTVTVRAMEPGGTYDEQSFSVVVTGRAGNQQPGIRRIIPAVAITLGQSVHITGSNHFFDPDGDDLKFEPDLVDPTVARHRVNGGIITFTGTEVGRTQASVRAVDTSGRAVTLVFPLTVGAILTEAPPGGGGEGNRPIILQRFEALTLTAAYRGGTEVEGVPHGVPHTYDSLYEFFRDPNGEPLTFTARAAALPNGRVAVRPIVIGSLLRLSPGYNTGTVQVTVTAENRNRRLSVSQTFPVTVNAPTNRAPIWNGPGSQVLGTATTDSAATEDNPRNTVTIKLTDRSDPQAHCYDPDGDNITLSVKSVTPSGICSATITGGDSVTIARTVANGQSGGAFVVLTATDDGTPAQSQDHSIRVRAVADGSTANPEPGVTINADHSLFDPISMVFPGPDVDLDFAGPASGGGGGAYALADTSIPFVGYDYDAEAVDATICRAHFDAADLEVRPLGVGSTTISGTIARRTGNTTPGTFSIPVTVEKADVPSSPEWSGPDASEVALTLGQTRVIDLDEHCSDEDGKTITYEGYNRWNRLSTNRAKFTGALSGTRNKTLTLTPVAVTEETASVFLIVRARTSGGSTDHRVEVVVSATDTPPVSNGLTVTAIPDFPEMGQTFYTSRNYDIDIRPYFTPGSAGYGVDWPRLEFERVSGLTTNSIRSNNGGILRLWGGGHAGTTRFRVRAYELETGNRTDWVSFDVTVAQQVIPRPIISRIGNRRVVFGDSAELDIADYTTYTGTGGKSALGYRVVVEYSTGGRAQGVVSRSGSVLTLGGAGVPLGYYKITCYAFVSANVLLYGSQTFYLSVRTSGGGGGGGTNPDDEGGNN